MSTVPAIIGMLTTILFGVVWMQLANAIPASIEGTTHIVALCVSLLAGLLAYHTLSN